MDTGTWGLYYNYTWWGNAIQTAPSVIGKPDFFGSQFEMLTSQQPNQVVNGNFATDSDWIKGTGWTISGGTANGNLTSNPILQTVSGFTAGNKYRVRFEVTAVTSGYVRVYAYVGASGTFTNIFSSTSLTTGVYEGTFEFGGTNKILRFYGSSGGSAFVGSIDNVSVQLVRADNVEAVKCLADWIHETQILDV